MIVTLTAHPSLDRTISLGGPLLRGEVQRAGGVSTEPGGKGVNVARVLTQAGAATLAVLPAAPDDPLLGLLAHAGVPVRTVPVAGPARTNLTLAEPDGTTTKVNTPGARVDPGAQDALSDALLAACTPGGWAVLSGSLPPGVDDDWYAVLVDRLRAAGVRVALDTSGAPLRAALAGSTPDLLKPNGEELAELVGGDPTALEADLGAASAAAAELVAAGVGAVLVTAGATGAALVTADGCWTATPPRIRARSTVGAGDSALAGYLLAETTGQDPAERLRSAVAHGSAAAALPGSALPRPADLRLDEVAVRTAALTALTVQTPGAVR